MRSSFRNRLRERRIAGLGAALLPAFPAGRRALAAVVLAAGSLVGVTSCAVGPSCSTHYVPPSDGAAGAAGAAAAGVNGPNSAITVGAGASAARPASTPRALPPSATVTLVTGDHVQVDTSPAGQVATAAIAPAQGAQATGSPGFVRFSWGGDEYVVPDAAVPYVGSTLDLRLFDVSYLVRAGLDDAHASSLSLQVSGDATALPGLQPAGRSAGTESAKLAKSATPAVGRLLASAWRARTPSAALRRLGTVTLAEAKGAPPLPTLPALPTSLPTASGSGQHWHTITLKFIGSDGAAGTGIGWVQNLSDARLGTTLVESDNPVDQYYPPVKGASGPVSFSVPDGTYSVEVSVLTPHPGTTNGTDAALVVAPQVTVNSDQTIVLDARTATSYQASIDPAVDVPFRVDQINMWRSSTTGGGCGGANLGGLSLGLETAVAAGYPQASIIGAAPVAKVTDGGLGFTAETILHVGDGQGPSPDPRYFLVFPSQGTIPSSLHYTVKAADLTTVHSHVYDNPSADCAGATPELWPTVYYPWGAIDEMRSSGGAPYDLSHVPPGDHTDYWYASDPKLATFQSGTIYYNYNDVNNPCNSGGIRYGDRRAIQPGEQIDETWNKAPTVPSSAAIPDFNLVNPTGSPFPNSQQKIFSAVAPATRQDDNGMVYLLRGGDSDPSHFMDDATTHSLSFYRDGELALSAPFVPQFQQAWGTATPLALDLPLLHRAATYKLDWTEQRYWSNTDVSPTTETAWTFHSASSDPAAAMPDGEQCAPDTSRPCSFLPLMFLHYDLPLNFNSQAVAGKPLPIRFTVSGQQGAPAPHGVSATVSESFDGGKTWTDPVQATSGNDANTFTATIDQPLLSQTNGSVYLKVHASDQDGNAVDQTMTPAYGLTGGQ